jgi:diguanylate cyclase (GGDEF)-like protein
MSTNPRCERRRNPIPTPAPNGRRNVEAETRKPAPGWFGRLPLQARLASPVVGLLVIFLAAAITTVWFGSLHFAHQRVVDDLNVGGRVLESALDQDRKRLAIDTRVLASEWPFRQALATHHVPTIESVLENHARRTEAHAALLLDRDGTIIARALVDIRPDEQASLRKLVENGTPPEGEPAVVSLGGRSMWAFAVPVRTPLPIGWLIFGFDLDGIAKNVGGLTGADVVVLGASGPPRVASGSIAPQALEAALKARPELQKQQSGSLVLDGDEYHFFNKRLEGGYGTHVMLLQSLEGALEPYRRLVKTLGALLALSLLAAALVSRRIAGSVAAPIRRLAQAVEAIGEGNYTLELPVETADEIGRLSAGFNRMTHAVAAREAEITRFAFADTLTGLHNRASLLREGDERLATIDAANPRHCMVLVLDIDRFKAVNNVLGHGVGDQVIIEAARRLRAALRDTDLVARLSGDEFAVLLQGQICEDAAAVHARFEETFSNPVELSGTPFDISVSLGMARCPEHGRDMAQLLRNAEIAMKTAKRRRTGFIEYAPEIDETRIVHLSLLSELRRAVEQDELRLYLQPKISLADGSVGSAEALVRWQHPVRGFMPPAEFIPFAEQTGRIGPLTRWVIRRALELGCRLKEDGQPLTISVNVSTQDIQDPRFPDAVDALLAETGAEPAFLRFEVTESGVMDNPELALGVLAALRLRGFSISIDDFGTGQASFAYLHRMPVSELKIDRSFIRDIHRDRDAEWLVRATIDLGHDLNLSVVAEGVESVEEWHVLRRLGCDEVQGYFASPPLPVDQFLAWRAARTPFLVEPVLATGRAHGLRAKLD